MQNNPELTKRLVKIQDGSYPNAFTIQLYNDNVVRLTYWTANDLEYTLTGGVTNKVYEQLKDRYRSDQ